MPWSLVIILEINVQPSSPIRRKSTTNRCLVTHIFPRLSYFSSHWLPIYCDWLFLITLGLVFWHTNKERSNKTYWIGTCKNTAHIAMVRIQRIALFTLLAFYIWGFVQQNIRRPKELKKKTRKIRKKRWQKWTGKGKEQFTYLIQSILYRILIDK